MNKRALAKKPVEYQNSSPNHKKTHTSKIIAPLREQLNTLT